MCGWSDMIASPTQFSLGTGRGGSHGLLRWAGKHCFPWATHSLLEERGCVTPVRRLRELLEGLCGLSVTSESVEAGRGCSRLRGQCAHSPEFQGCLGMSGRSSWKGKACAGIRSWRQGGGERTEATRFPVASNPRLGSLHSICHNGGC